MRAFLTTILCLFVSGLIASGELKSNQVIDSLVSRLNEASGPERVDILYELGTQLAPWDQEKAEKYVNEEKALAEALDYQLGIGKVLHNQGDIAFYRDDYSSALNYFNLAIDIFSKTNFHNGLGLCYLKLVLIFYNTNNWEKGIEYADKAKNAFRAGDNYLELSALYWGIGYFNNNYFLDFNRAKEVLDTAYRIAVDHNLPSAFKGGILASIGFSYSLSNQNDTAIVIYRKAIRTMNDSLLNDKVLKTQFIRELGGIYNDVGMTDSALFYLSLALNRARKMTHIFGMTYISLSLAETYTIKKDYIRSIYYYEQVIQNALLVNKTGKGYIDEAYKMAPNYAWDNHIRLMTENALRLMAKRYLSSASRQLSKTYETLGETGKAYEYYKMYHTWADSIDQIRRQKELYGFQIGFDTERKDQKIEMLQQSYHLQQYRIRQNSLFLSGLGGLVVIIILLSIIFIRQNRIKSEHQAILLKQKLFRSQMNPHFIFNSLGSIQSSIINEEPDKAVRYLSKFSKLMRNILDSSVEEVVSLEDELTTIENYLELQKVRFVEKFDYTIDLDESIDPENTFIPPMLAQPFIENAIEHGIKHKEGKGRIDIRIRRSGDQTIFEIEDDGVGREKARDLLLKLEENHKSLATVITRERIAALNKKSKKKITLEIIDLKDETGYVRGTLVRFGIPC